MLSELARSPAKQDTSLKWNRIYIVIYSEASGYSFKKVLKKRKKYQELVCMTPVASLQRSKSVAAVARRWSDRLICGAKRPNRGGRFAESPRPHPLIRDPICR